MMHREEQEAIRRAQEAKGVRSAYPSRETLLRLSSGAPCPATCAAYPPAAAATARPQQQQQQHQQQELQDKAKVPKAISVSKHHIKGPAASCHGSSTASYANNNSNANNSTAVVKETWVEQAAAQRVPVWAQKRGAVHEGVGEYLRTARGAVVPLRA